MKSVIQWAIRNSPAMNTLMVAILIVGAVGMFSMRREVFPEFRMEILLVSVPYPGASPEEVEEGICRKIEEAVRPIAGIEKQTSVAAEGSGSVVLELESNIDDIERVLAEVRSAVDRIPSFPELAEDPDVKQITMRQTAIRLGIVGPDRHTAEAELELRAVAERVRNDILALPSVTQADLIGARDYQIDIEIPEATLRKYGLTLQRVAEIVRRENIELPGGNIKTESQEVLLRGKSKHLVGTEIAKIPVVTQPNGVVLTVGDLGFVRDEFTDDTATSLINGKPGLVLSVERTSSEDVLEIVDEVKSYVTQASLPSGYSVYTWADRSVEVRDRLELLSRNGLQGLCLVFLVLAIFLELRLAFWVALGIPISVLGTCAILLYMDQTLNMLTTFAFLMALGIVVDDAIVIGENIYAHRLRKKGFLRAAVDGTVEVLPSVTASVTTTIIAFAPLMYVSGVMGKFIAVLPVAVIAMLIISLIESMFILPCHLAHSQDPTEKARPTVSQRLRRTSRQMPVYLRYTVALPALAILYVVNAFMYPFRKLEVVADAVNSASARFLGFVITRIYQPSLRWSLNNPAVPVSGAIALLLLSIGLFLSGVTPWSLMPKIDSESVEATIIFPDGTPASATIEATEKLEAAIRRVNARYEQRGMGFLEFVHRSAGQVLREEGPAGSGTQVSSGSHLGSVAIELVSGSERQVTSHRIAADWRTEAGEFPGAEKVTFGGGDMGPGGMPIEFKLLIDASADPDNVEKLEKAVEKVKARLNEYVGVFDVADDSAPGKWEYQLRIKDRAKSMGIPTAELAETVRASYYGEEVMRLQRGRHEVKLMVRYPRDERRSLANFDEIRIRTDDGAERPLTELANITVARGNSEINRVDQLRAITVTADVNEPPGNADQTVTDLQQNFIPQLQREFPGLQVRWEGQREQTQESLSSMFMGLGVALFAMFVLLTLQFRSYFQPLLILSIIPFGTIGAIAGHALLGMPLTLFSVFGLVALTGVVVNDSIVLIDFINVRVREHDLQLKDALLDAGIRRFRPVMLTSATTVAGLLPILLETSFQAQIVIPMATSLSFGLIFATLLVLYLIPTLYLLYARSVDFFTGDFTPDTHDGNGHATSPAEPVRDTKPTSPDETDESQTSEEVEVYST